MIGFLSGILATVALASGATAAEAGKNCEPLPSELKGWNQPVSQVSESMAISLAKASMVRLKPTASMTFSRQPERKPDIGSFSNTFKISIEKEGMYRLLADRPVWFDVVSNQGINPSLSHQHGPSCSNIRKMVDYKLTAGTHIVQLSGSITSDIKIMMIHLR